MTVRSQAWSLCVAGVLGLLASPAWGQGASTAAAEALFQDGRKAFKAGKYAEACPKLEESQRLDPATGTLLALALCHEQQKKYASAWAEFTDVETRARREGRKDRETLAREHAAALRPRLSTLVVEVPSEIARLPDLEVRIDGTPSGSGSWGVAVPVDGGDHQVEAKAASKKPWRQSIAVKAESHAARVQVPALEDAEPVAGAATAGAQAKPAAAGQAEAKPNADAQATGGSGKGMRLAGAVTAGAGVVAVGVGSFLALDAKSKYDDAKRDCTSTGCTSDPYGKIADARTQGNIATVVMVAGGAAIATGAALWFLAPRSSEEAPAQSGARIRRVGIGPGSFVVEGCF